MPGSPGASGSSTSCIALASAEAKALRSSGSSGIRIAAGSMRPWARSVVVMRMARAIICATCTRARMLVA